MVSRVTSEKLLNAFPLEPCVLSTQETVVVTRQMKLSTLVQAAWRYNLPFLKSRKVQTHTQNTRINIIVSVLQYLYDAVHVLLSRVAPSHIPSSQRPLGNEERIHPTNKHRVNGNNSAKVQTQYKRKGKPQSCEGSSEFPCSFYANSVTLSTCLSLSRTER